MQDRRLANFQIAWCAHGFLRELVLIYPVYAIMMGENDVSPTELALLFAAWSLSVIVLEVPSGALADRLSRKHLIAAGGLIKGVCFLVWLAMPTFWGYLIGFLVWGLGSSLASGTREALVHDTLKDWGAERLFVKVHGRGTAAQDLGVATALAGGGAIAELGYALPLALSTVAPWAASLLVLATIHEPPRSVPPDPDHAYLDTLRAGLREARSDRMLPTLIAMFSTIVVIYGVLDEFIGPYLDEKGASLTTVGLIAAGVLGARTLGSALAHRLRRIEPRGIALLVGASSLFIYASAALPVPVAGIPLAIYFAGCAAAEMQLQGRLQDRIRGEARATITSLAGMGREITGVLLYLGVGLPAELVGWQGSLLLLATAAVVASLAFARGPR